MKNLVQDKEIRFAVITVAISFIISLIILLPVINQFDIYQTNKSNEELSYQLDQAKNNLNNQMDIIEKNFSQIHPQPANNESIKETKKKTDQTIKEIHEQLKKINKK